MHPPGFEPMLASTGQAPDGDGWAYDLKLDGWRTLVHVNGGRVGAYSRPGKEITGTVPELSGLAEVLPDATVLDGELVIGAGRASSFYRLAPLLASDPQRRTARVTFVAFDVLALGDGTPGRGSQSRRLTRVKRCAGVLPSFEGASAFTVPQRGLDLADRHP